MCANPAARHGSVLGRVVAGAAAVLLAPVLVAAGGGVWLTAENVGTPAPTARDDPPRRPVGAALYVDFTATPDDWAHYTTHWVNPR